GVVQAPAPGHGTRLALPRPVGPGTAAVAGPRPRRRPRPDRRTGHRDAEGPAPLVGPVDCPARLDRVGGGGVFPRYRQARRRERSTDSSRAATRLGGERPDGTGRG